MKIKKNSKNLKILGVNFKDKEKDAKKFIKEFGNPYYFVAKDYDGRTSIDFGIYGIPESILIDENLRIIKKFIGPINNEDFNNILKLTK
jgi:cytochrome c biogenesis protein CcmG/thiol:disulfide interchange protein DsbE